MSKMAPNQSIMDSFDLGKKGSETDELLIIIGDKDKSEKPTNKKKHRKKPKKSLKEMWENDELIQIKGIQKTQEAVNRNLRQLHLDKLRISRNKRIEEASENIRRRRETQQQKIVLKEVLQKINDKISV